MHLSVYKNETHELIRQSNYLINDCEDKNLYYELMQYIIYIKEKFNPWLLNIFSKGISKIEVLELDYRKLGKDFAALINKIKQNEDDLNIKRKEIEFNS